MISADYLIKGMLEHQIKQCFVDVVKSAVPSLIRKRGYFDLFGCDFMVTTDNELRLLEINSNPAMSLGNLKQIIYKKFKKSTDCK